jgi:hypothetical protein
MPGAPRPFPFASLPRVDRAAARLACRVAAALRLAPKPPSPLLDDRWSSILGGPVRAIPGLARPVTADDLRAAWSAERPLVAAWTRRPRGSFLLALPRDLAFLLVTRALGPDAQGSPLDPLSELAEGALSALAAPVAVALCAPSAPPTLRAITDHPADALDALGAPGALVAWDVALSGRSIAGVVTLVFAADALDPAPPPPFADLAARLADALVAVRCVGARAALPAGEVAALAAGDALRLDGLRWSAGALAGDVTLCLGGPPALRLDATITDAARVTVAAPVRGPWSPVMSDPTEVLRGLHVDVTVEIAATTAPLEVVAAWGVGAVVEFPQRLGDAVVLRAGGRVVARGELVDVDGQVGVRVTALT